MSTDSSSRSPEITTTPAPARPGNGDDILGRLEKCVRQGDWSAVAGLTDQIGSDRLPETADELAERVRRLERVLIAARVARASLAASLTRVKAAAGFASSRAAHLRHRFADSTDF